VDDKTRKIFEAADIDPDDLTAVPGTAIHAYMVSADAWLDGAGHLLFVGQPGVDVRRFMYYIGEEYNAGPKGLGRRIVAFEIDEEREEWIRRRLPGGAP
jgi:hypothetical protein